MRRAVFAFAALTLLTPGCKAKKQLAETQKKLAATEAALADERKGRAADKQTYEERIAQLDGEIKQLTSQIDDLARKEGLSAKELAELRAEKAKREEELRVYTGLFKELKKLVDAGTIQVQFRNGAMVLKLSNAILFDSGKTQLRAEGVTAVQQLVPALLTVGKRDFLVAGHTDNVPIKTARFRNNWELSTARAVEMVNAMIAAGYPPDQVGAAGYGEFDPVADNSSEDGREQNRRIEIVLVPKLGDIPGMQELLTDR